MPPKLDDDKPLQNDTVTGNSNATTSIPPHADNSASGFKPEHLLELQEKITKEILSTKLDENTMHELQVNLKKTTSLY